jgi:Protein of unknown function (DUF2934)
MVECCNAEFIFAVCQKLLESTRFLWNSGVSIALNHGHNLRRSAMTETREEWIKKRAYALWEEEGRPSGRDFAHWEQARAERQALEGSAASLDGKEVKTRKRTTSIPKTNGVVRPAAAKKSATRKSA